MLSAAVVGIPYHFVKSFYTAMQMIFSIVCSKLISSSIECKFCIANAVSITANHCAKIRRILKIRLQAIEAHHNI